MAGMADRRTILILGAGTMQLPPIRAARRMGLRVIVADGNPAAVGREEADQFLHVDLKETDAMVDAARAVAREHGLDAVFTAGTDFSATVAYVAEKLGLPGTTLDAALNATDKFRMRGVLKSAGVAVPEFALIDERGLADSTISRDIRRLALPVVVKPVDSMGARGVVRADDWDQVIDYARTAVDYSRTRRVIVEEFIDGPEFSIDALVYAGTIQITGFADRHIVFPPYFIEIGHTLPTALPQSDQEAIIAEFERAVRALGIGPGAAKGDMKLSARGPVVGEIAARLSGGYMSGWTYPLATGVNLSEAAIRIALGEPPGAIRPRWNRTSAERAVVSIPGVIERVDGVDAARAVTGVEELFLLRGSGDAIQFPRNNVEKAANVIAVRDTRDAATDAAMQAVASIEVVLTPANDATDRFLFGAKPDSVPYAYEPRKHAPGGLPIGVMDTIDASADSLAAWSAARAAARENRDRLPIKISSRAFDALVDAPDWSGRTLASTVHRLCETGVLEMHDATNNRAVDRLFVQAVARGGLQGGRYTARSL